MTAAADSCLFDEVLHHGGGVPHPDAVVVYSTSDPDEARQYGDVITVRVQLHRPLIVQHRRGVSWRDALEQFAGGPWPKLLEQHDGIIYQWPASTCWKTGDPVAARQWAITRPDRTTAAV